MYSHGYSASGSPVLCCPAECRLISALQTGLVYAIGIHSSKGTVEERELLNRDGMGSHHDDSFASAQAGVAAALLLSGQDCCQLLLW